MARRSSKPIKNRLSSKEINREENNKQMIDVELRCKSLKIELLKQYIVNYQQIEDQDVKEIEEKLNEITVIYQNLCEIDKEFDFVRAVSNEMMKNKKFSSKNSKFENPRQKFKRRSNQQELDAFVSPDYSIGNKKTSRKFK
ncbi:hypothetical protein HERIO_974 [Hepatospora eriocheir]|uniref:Uncharacterized protein n=1 Tax=Hepatospora eriocheir TaxID=1081669 RepID=A0A1X0QBM0_9MICR|nr:hypothetical protein HERIO_974 [Hepatospora eriocheir]